MDLSREERPETPEATSLRILVPAFMISELRRAFEIGFLLFVPFLVIDLVIASVLMSMGMMMLPPVIVSLPFKLIFFVLVDGWSLVAGSLVQSFGTTWPRSRKICLLSGTMTARFGLIRCASGGRP
jgi:flagellar biosynthesis protein FliP